MIEIGKIKAGMTGRQVADLLYDNFLEVISGLGEYATEKWVTDKGYITKASLNGYATEKWVTDKGYITKASLNGYATEQWVTGRGYITASAVAERYATIESVNELAGGVSESLAAVDVALAERVEKTKFAEYFSTEMAKWFVKDDANRGIKPVNSYGLYSDTYVSAKGVSTGSGGSGGGSSYDRLDSWAEYTSAKAGYVLSALLGYDLHTRVNNLANAGYITASALSGYAKLSDIPTSLPASDVYSWAKAASKPSYAFSEITNKPTTLSGYGITDALSTSGGMMTSNSIEVLSLNTKSASLYPAIGFYNNGTRIGVLRLTGNKTAAIYDGNFNTATIIITNDNIGSQSVAYATSAGSSNKLDGYNLITEVTDWNSAPNTILKSSESNTANAPYAGYCYGAVLRFHRSPSIFYTDLVTNLYSDLLFYRRHSDQGYGDWKTIAFTDSNVASATKLQTPRTIWGQSFDGTGDVSGFLSGVDFIQSNTKNGYFVGNRTSGLNNVTDGGLMLWSYGNTPISFHTNASTRMKITSAGNVLIDTTEDIGFKFVVNGYSKLASIFLEYTDEINRYGGNLYLQHRGNGGSQGATKTGNIVMCDNGGNVLIGTTSDNGSKLYVNGDVRFDGQTRISGSVRFYGKNNLSSDMYIDNQSVGGLNFAWSDGVSRFFIGYNVGIGTSSPTEKLHVAGNIVATGSVTAKSSSDYRLKCEFDYNVDYQERLLSLGRVCDFNYTPHAQKREFAFADDKRHTSVIWQDAKKANITGFCSVEEDGYGTINPLSSDLIFTMVGAIQQGIVKTEDIEERVVRLEKENEALRKEINDMKGGRYGC